MENGGGNRPDLLVRAGQLVGLAGGAGILVWIVGGGILFARLWLHEDYRQLGPIVQLPKQLLISLGLVACVLPVIVVLALYLVFVIFLGHPPKGHPPRKAVVIWAVAAAILSLGIGLGTQERDWRAVAIAVAIGVLALATASLALTGQQALMSRGRSNATVAIASGLLLGVTAIPIGVLPSVLTAPPYAKVCTEEDQVVGRFIGEADDRVYLADFEDNNSRVVSLPNDGIKRVFVAETNESVDSANCVMAKADRDPSNPPAEVTEH